MSNFVGVAVSVNCGEPLGCYQGTVLEANTNTITLTKAFRNGFPYPKSQVTLNAADIKELKIIEARSDPPGQTHSTVAVSKNAKKGQRATVCENLQANPTSSGTTATPQNVSATTNTPKANTAANTGSKLSSVRGAGAPAAGLSQLTSVRGAGGAVVGPTQERSKPIQIQAKGNNKSNQTGSYGSTPKSRGSGPLAAGGGAGGGGGGGTGYDKARRRNEACFGELADPALEHDFDFEGNLALFDKRGLWERMQQQQQQQQQRQRAQRPDLVRQADELGSFRHDENVLGGAPATLHAVRLPAELRGPLDYVTDEGVVVQSATAALRRRLWAGLARSPLADSARALLARAAADVALRLVGGGRRLDPRNAHQAPAAVVLAAPHAAGAAGVLAARLLLSHGVRAHVHLAGGPAAADRCAATRRELDALALAGGELARLERLPSADVVLVALSDPRAEGEEGEGVAAALRWAGGARAALVCVEPPGAGCAGGAGWASVCARAAVQALLPGALPPALGRVYLADVAPPPALFAELRCEYRPPFGALSVLPLHPADE